MLSKENRYKQKNILVSLLCIAVAAASWIFNMGWLRFFMTFLLIPFIHAIVFFLTNLFSANYIQKSKKSKDIYIAFCATYLLFNLLLPDGSDTGEMYVLFGLVHSDAISYICSVISLIAIAGHIVCLISQIIEIAKMRKTAR